MAWNKQKKNVFFSMVWLMLGISFSVYAHSDKKILLEQTNNQIQQIKTTLDQQKKQQVDVRQQLKISEMTLAALSQDIFRLNQSQQSEQNKLIQFEKQKQQVQLQAIRQQQQLGKQLQVIYQLGQLNQIKVILNQENMNSMNRSLGYYRELTQQHILLMAQIKQTLSSLSETMETIEVHQASLNALLEQKKQQQSKQEEAKKIRLQWIKLLNQSVQTKEQQLAVLIANQQALQETLEPLQTQTASFSLSTPFQQLQGKLYWPVSGKMLTHFGSDLGVGNQRSTGVTIKAPLGTPVRAIAQGHIIFANWLRGFGLLVIINHGNGYMSLYARNQSMNVKVGDQVKVGEIIATMGNTGGYDVPSLYFEIRKNGSPVNPSIWCRYT